MIANWLELEDVVLNSMGEVNSGTYPESLVFSMKEGPIVGTAEIGNVITLLESIQRRGAKDCQDKERHARYHGFLLWVLSKIYLILPNPPAETIAIVIAVDFDLLKLADIPSNAELNAHQEKQSSRIADFGGVES